MREGLIDYVQREYPQFLPRLRAEVGSAPDTAGPAPAP
jgi:hypothetical protein